MIGRTSLLFGRRFLKNYLISCGAFRNSKNSMRNCREANEIIGLREARDSRVDVPNREMDSSARLQITDLLREKIGKLTLIS